MELLIISENKIKISLTKTDLDGYSISCDSIDYDTTETRRVVWSLLDDVKKQSGFDAAKSKIFVQIYPSIDGGCELYVSKLGKADAVQSVPPTEQKRSRKKCRTDYYIFKGINELLAVCKMLLKRGYSGSSDAYTGEDGRFILGADSDSFGLDFISEFGLRQSPETAELYVNEHCREICTGCAVETLGKL